MLHLAARASHLLRVGRKRQPDQRRKGFRAAFAHGRGAMVFDGALIDAQFSGNDLVWLADQHMRHNLTLAPGQVGNPLSRGLALFICGGRSLVARTA